MLLQDDLEAKVFYDYKTQQHIYAFCDKNGACRVESASMSGFKNDFMKPPEFYHVDSDGKSEILRRLETHFGPLFALRGASEIIAKLWHCYRHKDLRLILLTAQTTYLRSEMALQFLSAHLRGCITHESQSNNGFPTESLMNRYENYLHSFENNKDLAFNLLLIQDGKRPSMLIHKIRYYHTPKLYDAVINKVKTISGVDCVETPDRSQLLVYNNVIISSKKAMIALDNEVIMRQIIGFLCTDRDDPEWVVSYMIDKQVFYIEPCKNQPNWAHIYYRLAMWEDIGKQVNGHVTMNIASVVSEKRLLELLIEADPIAVYMYRMEIARQFFRDDYWVLTGNMFANKLTTVRLMDDGLKKYGTVWQFIAFLKSRDHNPFLARDASYKTTKLLRILIPSLESKFYKTLEHPYDIKYIMNETKLMKMYGLNTTATNIFEKYAKNKYVLSMILDLVFIFDELALKDDVFHKKNIKSLDNVFAQLFD